MYQLWEKGNYFTPRGNGEPYTIIMPPPNANDPLHIGHAMFVTAEDILIRYHRMRGDATLWLPGADHAGIETQFVFEKKLKKEGKSRFSFDRETLYTMIWDYVDANKTVAINQMKKLGASADWSKFTFTLDPEVVDFVLATFEKMHTDGLIYRGLRLVNYCTRCGTGYSELEVKYEERKNPLYYMKYGPFTLATVRPETKFGDTAVAVNPTDKRYQQYVGKEIEVQGLLGTFKMKVIADEHVDPEFGTGVIKVTPAHDPNDFAIGKRHHLEVRQVIGFDGKLNEHTGLYAGLKVEEARKKVVEDLKAKGLLVKVDEHYTHNVGVCYRCGMVIEPLPMAQFFVKVKPLTEPALAALNSGKTIIHGAGHDKILRHWLTNLEDWNISRQIVWGIRLPIWYSARENPNLQIGFLNARGEFTKGTIGKLLKEHSFEEIEKGLQTLSAPVEATYMLSRPKPGKEFLQDTDTLDTWFSSSQWPVVTLKVNGKRKKEKGDDFERFYPTQVMETAYDILMFWVMRMMMMGIYLTGKTPFKEVYLHGLVRDEKGLKMSKSKGNVVNPLDIVEAYGADALRMALVMSTTPGHDSAVGEQKVKGMRNFANKVWNAARFIELQRQSINASTRQDGKKDKEFNDKLKTVAAQVTGHLDNLRIGLAAETVHNEFWHWFCDEAIEKGKTGEISLEALKEGLQTFLKLLHPFMPFVTEEIWGKLAKKDNKPLIISKWPAV